MRFFCLCFFSTTLLACEKPLTIGYAPFISLLVAENFLGKFHQKLEAETGCKVEYSLTGSFDDFLLDVFRQKYNMTFVPAAYDRVMTLSGYKVLASEKAGAKREFSIISHKSSGIKSVDDLAGRNIQIISQMSSSGNFFLEQLEEKGLITQVKIHYGGTYDSIVLAVLKKQVDAAVIIPEYMNVLDKRLRDSQLNIIGKIIINSDVDFFVTNVDDSIIPIIRKSLIHTPVNWGEPITAIRGNKSLRVLLDKKHEQFLELKGKSGH